MNRGKLRVGIAGYTYEDWRGTFYPKKLPIKDELAYAASQFSSIEINGTFYKLQRPHTFAKWYKETPDDFLFSIKAPKYVTHERRLVDVNEAMANFFASGVLNLEAKLGPILWQLPPNLTFNQNVMESFLNLLPRTTKDASHIAKSHSDWMSERASFKVTKSRPLYHAFEVRNHSFADDSFIKLMKNHGIAIVVGDTAGRWPLIEEVCSPISYLRLHGDEVLFPKGYTKKALKTWALKAKQLTDAGQNVHVYFDNDHKTAAPKNALEFIKITDAQT